MNESRRRGTERSTREGDSRHSERAEGAQGAESAESLPARQRLKTTMRVR